MTAMTAATTQNSPPALAPVQSAQVPSGREERIMDDDGNSIIVHFPFEPTLEIYDFLKDYLEFRINRLRRTTQAKVSEDSN